MKKEKELKPTKKQEDWMSSKWRPMMAVMYMMVCIFDFILFPIMFTIVQFWETQAANDAFRQWNPITLGGGGLFHVAMGAVLGVTAWSRGQEKMAGVASAPAPMSLPAPTPGYSTGGFNSQASSFGAPAMSTGGWDNSSSMNTATVTVGFGGKMAPPRPDFYPER